MNQICAAIYKEADDSACFYLWEMEFKRIHWGSADYESMKELRIQTLLMPIGVPASYIEPENEKEHILLGGFEGSACMACCILTPKGNDTWQLRQMVVNPDLQGKGTGASLLQFAEQAGKNAGARCIMMHAREPVTGFYEKSGYQVTGPLFFEVGIPHYVMEKNI